MKNIAFKNEVDIYGYSENNRIINSAHRKTKYYSESYNSANCVDNINYNFDVIAPRKDSKKSETIFKNRFLASVFIVMFILLSMAVMNSFIGNSMGAENKKYIKITVTKGDTLWNIAKEYKSKDGDLKKTIYDICKINNINAHNLKAGMELKIPNN